MSDRLNGGNEGFLYTANDECPLKWESLGKERGGRGEQSDRAEGGEGEKRGAGGWVLAGNVLSLA